MRSGHVTGGSQAMYNLFVRGNGVESVCARLLNLGRLLTGRFLFCVRLCANASYGRLGFLHLISIFLRWMMT